MIPIVKDEGIKGDRDFLQWDTISLMSLLDVYVILGYYNKAEKHKVRENKITNQQYDNDYIISKIKEIENYHSSALHWNLKEINSSLPILIDKVKKSYSEIEQKLEIKLHSSKGLDTFENQLKDSINSFINSSRYKAKEAQFREFNTKQPKESLKTSTKARITINNYLGGKYFLTIDEFSVYDNTLFLIESKHSKFSLLPSKNDIKDGLLKMILYCNLTNVTIDKKIYNYIPILNLTSTKIKGLINSDSSYKEIHCFCEDNQFNITQKNLVNILFKEANTNKFKIIIQNG